MGIAFTPPIDGAPASGATRTVGSSCPRRFVASALREKTNAGRIAVIESRRSTVVNSFAPLGAESVVNRFTQRRNDRIAEGACVQCGARDATKGRTLCAPCAATRDRGTARRRAFRVSQGLCKRHGNPTAPNSKGCYECQAAWMKSQLAQRAKRATLKETQNARLEDRSGTHKGRNKQLA